jgi:hypothetical protein
MYDRYMKVFVVEALAGSVLTGEQGCDALGREVAHALSISAAEQAVASEPSLILARHVTK